MKLIQIQTGDWINPDAVVAVEAEMCNPLLGIPRPRAVINLLGNVRIFVPTKSDDDAKIVREKLVQSINNQCGRGVHGGKEMMDECTSEKRTCYHNEKNCSEEFKSFKCTREIGHKGMHVACGNLEHNYETWDTNEEKNTTNTVPEGCKLVAVFDGCGESCEIGLYVEKDGETVAILEWPKSWPETMSRKKLEEFGFECVTAYSVAL